MTDDQNSTPATDAVKALHLFLLGPEGEGDLSPGKISEKLERAGIDARKMAAEIRKQISQAQNRLRLTEIRTSAESIAHQLTKPVAAANLAIGELREAVQRAIERISAVHPEAAAVFHRKLEESTEDDLTSLLEDLKQLEAKGGIADEGQEGR